MILGLEDIPGGQTAFAYLIWLALTALFYLVCYMAVLNVIDDVTKNRWSKIPMALAVSVPSALIMSVFSYRPTVLFLLMAVSNYFRVTALAKPESKRFKDLTIRKPLFFAASYLYIVMVPLLAWYFQVIYFPSLDI